MTPHLILEANGSHVHPATVVLTPDLIFKRQHGQAAQLDDQHGSCIPYRSDRQLLPMLDATTNRLVIHRKMLLIGDLMVLRQLTDADRVESRHLDHVTGDRAAWVT